MTEEESTKIANFMTPWAGVQMLGHDHTSHYSEYTVFYSINKLHIYYYCVKGLWSYTIVDFHLFYDGAVDIQI